MNDTTPPHRNGARSPLPVHQPRLARHPLMGADLTTLLTVLRRDGFVPPARFGHLAAALGSALLRWPFRRVERWQVERQLSTIPDPPSPLFILGHWRSGTTHLFNLLSRDPRFACPRPIATGLPWEFLTVGRLLRPLLLRTLPETRWVDAIAVEEDSPQEDEVALANMDPVSFYHGVYFPRRFRDAFFRGVFFDGCTPQEVEGWRWAFIHFLGKLRIQQGAERRPLVKNPVYTARVTMLRELFPEARFIHIRRNPYEVFGSTVRFWRVLFGELAWQDPGRIEEAEIEEIVLEGYARMMQRLDESRALLSDGDYMEIELEELRARPLPTLRSIYERMELEGYAEAEPRFSTYLDSLEQYGQRSYRLSDATQQRIRERWGPYLDRGGYRPPS